MCRWVLTISPNEDLEVSVVVLMRSRPLQETADVGSSFSIVALGDPATDRANTSSSTL